MKQLPGKTMFCEVLCRALQMLKGIEIGEAVAESCYESMFNESNSLVGSALYTGLVEQANLMPAQGRVSSFKELLSICSWLDSEVHVVIPARMFQSVIGSGELEPVEKYQSVLDGYIGKQNNKHVHTEAFRAPDGRTSTDRIYVIQIEREENAVVYRVEWYQHVIGA